MSKGKRPTKEPGYYWFPGDWWRSTTDARMVSLAAQGLWRNMLDLMHDCPRRGFLELPDGDPMLPEHIASAIGKPVAEVTPLLAELERFRVFSRDKNQLVIYSRRMVNDERERLKAIANGRLGGNPVLKKGVNPPDKLSEGRVGKDSTERSSVTPGETLPTALDTPEFRETWQRWKKHRAEKREKLTPSTQEMQLKKLEKLGVATAVATLNHAIEKGWTGFGFELDDSKQKPRQNSGGRRDSNMPLLLRPEDIPT